MFFELDDLLGGYASGVVIPKEIGQLATLAGVILLGLGVGMLQRLLRIVSTGTTGEVGSGGSACPLNFSNSGS